MKKTHSSAAIEGDTRPPGADEAVDLHFVAFVECGGKLWELDGRKTAPVEHGATSKETFLKDAAQAIRKEFVQSETAEGSINFNLLALVGGGGGGGGEGE
jgi:ubiquitin carboxyl-terminal hydrolase L3